MVFTASVSGAMDSLATLTSPHDYDRVSSASGQFIVRQPYFGLYVRNFRRFTASSQRRRCGCESAAHSVASGCVIAGHRRPAASFEVTCGPARTSSQSWVFDQTGGTFTAFAKLTACVG